MSQLEVDKIIPQSGTTLTIGDSGDTISFAEGTNLGIDTNTLVIDSTNNRVGIKNASPTVELDVTGDVKVAGDINLGDSDKIILGAGNDLEIYHDGSDSFIKDIGAGNLNVWGGNFRLRSSDGSEQMIDADSNGTVRLYYDGSEKLATTSTGADVRTTTSGAESTLRVSSRFGSGPANVVISSGGTGDAMLRFDYEENNTDRARIGISSSSYSLMFFNNGNNERMRIDNSGYVGIGTSSPGSFNSQARNLVIGSGSGDAGMTIYSGSTSGDTGNIFFADGTSDPDFIRGGITYDHGTNQMKFRINDSNRMEITSSGNVGIGTASPTFSAGTGLHLNSSGNDCRLHITNSVTGTGTGDGVYIFSGSDSAFGLLQAENADMRFYTNATERMRMTGSGVYLIGKTATGLGSIGHEFHGGGFTYHTRSGDVMYINRTGSDGTLINFYQDTSSEGYIGVSGSTVSYNGFTGTHWSRLSDNSKPTILKGTILESLDEMCDWYQVKFDITQTDDEGNNTTFTEKVSYALQEGQSVGDIITYNHEGIDYQATIIQEDDIKHTKSKVSDTADAKNVYGVFMDWDNNDDTVNDMLVAQTGTFVVRLNSSVTTLNKGDLIQSNGDGTGKVQSDDIIRASTVAKILSTTKIETYEDGSYIVPCSLHC